MIRYASAAETRRATAEGYKPRERLTVSQGIAKVLHTKTGKYEPGIAAYMATPADALGSRRYRVVVFIGPARCSKTVTLIDGWAAYKVVYAPGDMLVVQASQDLSRYYSKMRIGPMIEASPEVRARKSVSRQDDNTYDKVFKNGMVLAFGWPSGAQLSGRDFQAVAVTEYDAAADDIDGEGSLFALALKRTETFMSAGKMVVETSIRREYRDARWSAKAPFLHEAPPAGGATTFYNMGTRCWFYWRCVECGEWFALDPDIHAMFNLPPLAQLVDELDGGDPAKWAAEHAHIGCRHCGVEIPESLKGEMNRAGVWVPDGCRVEGEGDIVGTPRDTHIDSYQLSCIAAAYGNWRNILEVYAAAIVEFCRTGDETNIKSTVNLDQGRAYLPISVARGDRNPHELQTRAERWPDGHVPEGVRFLTAAIDIQAGRLPRFVIQVEGVGVGRERWIIDRYALKSSARPTGEVKDGQPVLHPIDPASYIEDWDRLLDKVIRRRYPLADGSGRSMPIKFVCCDSGGKAGVTRRAYQFVRRLQALGLHWRFRLVKGAEREGAKTIEETKPDTRGRKDRADSGAAGDVPLLVVNVTQIKDIVDADIKRDSPGPGFYHFPVTLDSRFYEELTAETRGAKRWDREGKKANESFDLCAYNEVALIKLGADRFNWDQPPPWAEVWDKNPDVHPDGELPPPPVAAVKRRPSTYLSPRR